MVNRQRHRTNNPAFIEWYENGQKKQEKYYINGLYHRLDGPAIIRWEKFDVVGRERCEVSSPTESHREYWIRGYKILPEWFTQFGKDIKKDFSNESVRDMILNIYGDKWK